MVGGKKYLCLTSINANCFHSIYLIEFLQIYPLQKKDVFYASAGEAVLKIINVNNL